MQRMRLFNKEHILNNIKKMVISSKSEFDNTKIDSFVKDIVSQYQSSLVSEDEKVKIVYNEFIFGTGLIMIDIAKLNEIKGKLKELFNYNLEKSGDTDASQYLTDSQWLSSLVMPDLVRQMNVLSAVST